MCYNITIEREEKEMTIKQQQIESIMEKLTEARFELESAEGERKRYLEFMVEGYKVQLEVLGK